MVQNGVELQPQPISMRTRQILARGEQLGYSGDEERARSSDTPSTEDTQSTSSGERDMSHITSPPRRRRRLVRPTLPVPSTSAGFSGLNLRMLRTPRSDSDSSE